MKNFNSHYSDILEEIIVNRRDVRGNRFKNTEITTQTLDKILFAAVNAPSVGFSQPWEFVIIKDKATKREIKSTFKLENEKAKDKFSQQKGPLYNQLKLEGITEAPVNIAVFYKPSEDPVLGQTSMPEVGVYSVVCAVQNMWLMARSLNVGLGWVSILDPDKVKKTLNAPDNHQLVAYLCLGYVDIFYQTPELEQLNWAKRKELSSVLVNERY